MGELTKAQAALLQAMVQLGSLHCIYPEPVGSLVRAGFAKARGNGRFVPTPAGLAALAQEQSHER